MTLYQITVYHNDESRFMPYADGHRLTAEKVYQYLHQQRRTR